ncbi:MAG TPA: universal stress protein [Candidatus Binatus sp.]|uniref:universal stress protein n=1 Tax=Candidatus Binatus sp. TaxID=2811406 RepID=UPI002B462A8C|nr:universal stress protein [Candidatus Binatus sp.]HKN15054.1 universal stress protein [Candidatus Binatus sp.]
MEQQFRRILCPVDFDDNSMQALDTAANLARESDGTVFVLHVVPMIIAPTGMPVYVDLYKGQEEAARAKLLEIAHKRLAGVKHELLIHTGEPAGTILNAEKKTKADVIVMATHGRRGFKRFFLGSIAELVLRESICPVLTVRSTPTQNDQVGTWMTKNPVTATAQEKLASIAAKMHAGNFRSVPIVSDGAPVGIVTDRDIRQHTGFLDHTEAFKAMSEAVITVTPTTDIREAARLLRERKIGALPVVEGGRLAGVITTSDVLEALSHGTEHGE